jgi:hypothetical protein
LSRDDRKVREEKADTDFTDWHRLKTIRENPGNPCQSFITFVFFARRFSDVANSGNSFYPFQNL